MMRSDKLGYNAPIVVRQNRYYTYEDPEYSIADVPLSSQDTELLSEAVGILKQLSGFSALSGIEDIVGRLEDHVSAARHEKRPVIWFEKNDSLVGLHHLMPLYPGEPGPAQLQEFPKSEGKFLRIFRICPQGVPQPLVRLRAQGGTVSGG